jgi:hypothetical protein
MFNYIADILERIPEPPVWWDEGGWPRYCEFHPGKVMDIYANQVALVRIACQNCGMRFSVAVTWTWTLAGIDALQRGVAKDELAEYLKTHDLKAQALARVLGWNDPPNVGCCHAGPTMSSDTVRVLEFWENGDEGWMRLPEYELPQEEPDEIGETEATT